MPKPANPSKSYIHFIDNLKNQIKTSRIKAHLAVNRELVLLYFKIGRAILEKQEIEGWGSKIIERISRDLRDEFPEMTGLSTRNLEYMQQFADMIENQLAQQPAALIYDLPFFTVPWSHNMVLLDQNYSNKERLWYAEQIIENGWSRSVLMHQIKSDLYARQVDCEKSHNFHLTLPKEQSDLADSILKDAYNFEFLRGNDFKERNLEDHLVDNIVKFLLELGKGFAFVGKEYHLEVGGQDFYIDLLFYNIRLKCFVIIELKTGSFKPEFIGKMGFYLSVVDDKLRSEGDRDSIGIILCTQNNKEITAHSTKYMMKPVGVSEYKVADKIKDKKVKEIMPSIKELESIVLDRK